MNELIRNFIANGFADFEGLQISGTIPIKQEILNEAIAAFLQEGQAATAAGTPPATTGRVNASSPMPPIPPDVLLKMVRRAEVKATDGKITLEFEIRR
jgi:hypothetical protein